VTRNGIISDIFIVYQLIIALPNCHPPHPKSCIAPEASARVNSIHTWLWQWMELDNITWPPVHT
jgi:hypothetical protein